MMSFELFIGDGTVGTVGKCPWFAKQKKEKNEHYRLKSFAYNKKNAKTVPENMGVVLVNVNVGDIRIFWPFDGLLRTCFKLVFLPFLQI